MRGRPDILIKISLVLDTYISSQLTSLSARFMSMFSKYTRFISRIEPLTYQGGDFYKNILSVKSSRPETLFIREHDGMRAIICQLSPFHPQHREVLVVYTTLASGAISVLSVLLWVDDLLW